MAGFQRILFPVDLSQMSLSARSLATDLAKQHSAKLCFVHVAPPLFPEEAMYGEDYERTYDDQSKSEFQNLRPDDDSVMFEHIYLQGNAGPEIVRLTKPGDLLVLSTHGRSAMLRFVMGSVAQYVLRNANCPVILARGLAEFVEEECLGEKHFVTEIMDHVSSIQTFDNIHDVAKQFNDAGETAAPVINVRGKCIGILTTSDIENYRSLKRRFEAKDLTVLDEMFEVDKYGMRRADNHNFDHVERHMTAEVVSIQNCDSINDALSLFQSNPDIHHLVVVDRDGCPVGMVDSKRAFATAELTKTQNVAENEATE